MLKELDELMLFSNSLTKINQAVNTDNLNDYWKGFIYRRYKFDNVPISEIQASIASAQLKIKEIDVTKQPDVMYEININNQIALYYSIENLKIYSKNNQKEIFFNYDYTIQKIKYFKDNTGEYYQLIGLKNETPINFLFNNRLEKID